MTFDEQTPDEKLREIALCHLGKFLMNKQINANIMKSLGLRRCCIVIERHSQLKTTLRGSFQATNPCFCTVFDVAHCDICELQAGDNVWHRQNYVKLPDFCYLCGLLGHVAKGCDHYDSDTPQTDYQYGAEPELKEEEKLFLAFRSAEGNPKSHTKLIFKDGSSKVSLPIGQQHKTNDGSSKICADETEVVTLGNDVLKHKLEENLKKVIQVYNSGKGQSCDK
ncbi:hypothetical protein Cgig2_002054 [Carnegiea gigantea]|uniref:CCHC-type domain-containing protein n=1 Tax=Carnegiea gigantea TaxID=171969 RepID=A0A9Q1JX67_9CARY|nr:hypothetical protein Cgig2_002054 [Carnegiea gigantea]